MRRYAVVKFVKETVNGVPLTQEVPEKWLSTDKKNCYWPPCDADKQIRNYVDPDVKIWSLHPIELRTTSDNLSAARRMCLEDTGDEEESQELGRHMRRRRETYKHMFRDPSVSPPPTLINLDSNEEIHGPGGSSYLPNAAALPNTCAYSNSNEEIHGSGGSSYLPNSAALPRIAALPNTCPNSNEEIHGSGGSSYLSNVLPDAVALPRGAALLSTCTNLQNVPAVPNMYWNEGHHHLSSSYQNSNASGLYDTGNMEHMVQELSQVKTHISDLKEVLRNIQKQLANIDLKVDCLSERNQPQDQQFLGIKELLPLKSVECMDTFVQYVNEKSEVVASFIKLIGGCGPKDHHSRVFKYLFTNQFGCKCTWKGQRNNIKIENLNFIVVAMDVFKEVWGTTEKEFEVFSREWLRHCTQRSKKEQMA